jgi:ankyrin repeat protein
MFYVKDGSTPLHFAITEGNDELLQLLIERKADPNLKDKVINFTQITPLLIVINIFYN